VKEGVAGLTRDIMTIQAEGNYAAAKALGEKMGIVRPDVQKALDKLAAIPVDIEPQFVTAEELLKKTR
jgi:biotin operon repressor